MPTDDYDLPDLDELTGGSRGGGGRAAGEKPGRRRRRWPWFVAGLVLGVVAAAFVPDLARPYLPGVLRGGGEEVRGPVLAKRVEADRLLLTVDTERGALLAVVRRRVAEIDLLVEEGDSVTLSVDAYTPLVEDPVISAVRKPGGRRVPLGPADPGEPGEAAPGDERRDGDGAGDAADPASDGEPGGEGDDGGSGAGSGDAAATGEPEDAAGSEEEDPDGSAGDPDDGAGAGT